MSYRVLSFDTVDDLLSVAALEIENAEEDGEKPDVADLLRSAEMLTEIIESQAGVQAQDRMRKIEELRRKAKK